MNIAFPLGLAQLKGGHKTQTRRIWKPRTIETIMNQYDHFQRRHKAWSKMPHAGGEHIGWIFLIKRPHMETLSQINKRGLKAEGGRWTRAEFLALFPKGTGDVLVLDFEYFNKE